VGYLPRAGAGRPGRWTATVGRPPPEAGSHPGTVAAVAGAPPDRDAAARAPRHGVTWRELSPGTAGAPGGRSVGRMPSGVATGRRRGRDAPALLTACSRAALEGTSAPSPFA
jgi:hypothetical protein